MRVYRARELALRKYAYTYSISAAVCVFVYIVYIPTFSPRFTTPPLYRGIIFANDAAVVSLVSSLLYTFLLFPFLVASRRYDELFPIYQFHFRKDLDLVSPDVRRTRRTRFHEIFMIRAVLLHAVCQRDGSRAHRFYVPISGPVHLRSFDGHSLP